MSEDMRIPTMQEKLERVMSKIQDLHIQATAGNVENVYDAIQNLQIVYNTLEIMRREQENKDDGRETEAE